MRSARAALAVLIAGAASIGAVPAAAGAETPAPRPADTGSTAEAAPSTPAMPDGIAPRAADRALLERVIADSEVDTRRADPGWTSYLRELGRRLVVRIAALTERVAEKAGLAVGWVAPVVWTLAVLAVLALAAAVVAAVRGWRRRRRQPVEPPARALEVAEPPPADFDWRAEIDRRLAAGRVHEALEAAWHWLARALCGERAEASWTGGELVARGGRPDVAPAVARLDAMTYGPRRPAQSDVTGLIERLERLLAAVPATAPAGADR